MNKEYLKRKCADDTVQGRKKQRQTQNINELQAQVYVNIGQIPMNNKISLKKLRNKKSSVRIFKEEIISKAKNEVHFKLGVDFNSSSFRIRKSVGRSNYAIIVTPNKDNFKDYRKLNQEYESLTRQNKQRQNRIKQNMSELRMEKVFLNIPENLDDPNIMKDTVKTLIHEINYLKAENIGVRKFLYPLPLRQLIEKTRNKLLAKYSEVAVHRNQSIDEEKWNDFYNSLQQKGCPYNFISMIGKAYKEQCDWVHGNGDKLSKELIAKAVCSQSDEERDHYEEMFKFCFNENLYDYIDM